MFITPINPPNMGWIEIDLDDSMISNLWKYSNGATEDVRGSLAGNISRSFALSREAMEYSWDAFLEEAIRAHVDIYGQTSNEATASQFMPFGLDSLWVNYQKQGEVNPLHNHAGVYSFVIWLNIPTDWREQHALPEVQNAANPVASNFAFSYTNIMGDIVSYPYHLDKSMEGKMLLFPSKLTHQVYPFFNCEDERVSVAGNVTIVNK